MAFLDFGIYQGAAVKVPYESMMQQNIQMKAMERQYKVDAENKAKLLADDMDFGSATTEFNSQRLNDFYTGKMKEIGNFVASNPDLFTSPEKLIQLKAMKRDLKDNPIIAEDMNFQTNYKNAVDWMAKNPHDQDDPSIIRQLEEIENYRKYGTTDINSKERKQYTFINPDTEFDLPTYTKGIFSGIETHGQVDNGDGTYSVEATEEEKYQAAQFLLSNKRAARVYKNQWESLPPEIKKEVYKDDINMYVKKTGEPFVKPRKTEAYPVAKGGSGKGSGQGTEGLPYQAIWDQQIVAAQKAGAQGQLVALSPDVVNEVYINKANGTMDLNGSMLISNTGKDSELTNLTAKQRSILASGLPAIPKGGMAYDPINRFYYTPVEIQMSEDAFVNDWFDGDGSMVDTGMGKNHLHGENGETVWSGFAFGMGGEKDVRDVYTSKTIKNAKGEDEVVYSFMMKKPIQPNDDQLMGAYAKSAHVGTLKTEDFVANDGRSMLPNYIPAQEVLANPAKVKEGTITDNVNDPSTLLINIGPDKWKIIKR